MLIAVAGHKDVLWFSFYGEEVMPIGYGLFFHLSSVFIKSLDKEAVAGARIQDIVLLGSAEKLDWQLTDEGLEIRFPEHKPCSYAYTFKIVFDREVGKDLQSEASDEILKHGSPV